MSLLALIKDGVVHDLFAEGGWFTWPGGLPTCPAETKWPGADGYRLVPVVPAPAPADWQRRVSGSRRHEVDGDVVREVYDLEDDVEAYARAVQGHMDQQAQQAGYDDIRSAVSYADSSIPAWAVEAVAFRVWRDQVWLYAHAELAKAQAGERERPTVAEFLTELPALDLPEA